MPSYSALPEATAALVDNQRETLDAHDDRFEAAKELTRLLGAHWRDGHAEFGFWTPQLVDEVPESAVELELLTPTEDVDLTADEETVAFDRQFVETRREGEFTWAAVDGVQPGTRDRLGTLYRLSYAVDGEGWELALTSPGLDVDDADEPLELADSDVALFVRSRN